MNSITQPGAMISCPNCRQPFSANVQQVFDVGQDPSDKVNFLSGQSNVVRCPNCNYGMTVSTPVAYHDPSKELLLVHVPLELNLSNDEQERIVGQMTRTVTDSLPMEQRKGYLFNPRRAFTLQGMIETILEADGITKEMMVARRKKVDLMQELVEAGVDEAVKRAPELDDQLDEEFFQMLTLTIETSMASGMQGQAIQLANVRDALLEVTSYGQEVIASMERQQKAIEEVTQDVQKLGNAATRENLVNLALTYVDDDDKLQVLVAMTRTAMDYQFFQIFSDRFEETSNKQKRTALRDVRDRLIELTEQVDQQRQAQIQQASMMLQEIINSDDLEGAVNEAMPYISDLMIAVLEANIRSAEEQGHTEMSERLNYVYEAIRQNINNSAPPEVQFINELMTAENEMEARLMLLDRAAQYGENLLRYMDALIEDLSSRGADHLVDQLVVLREEAEKALQ